MKLRKLPYHLTVCKVESLSAIDLASEFFFIGRTDEEDRMQGGELIGNRPGI